jgi:hypothetical protein
MTLLVGVNLGEYVLFGADSRETFFADAQAEPTTREDFKKIVETPIGLAAGAGLTMVLSKVIEELSAHPREMADPDEVAEYLRDFRTGFLSSSKITDERIAPLAGPGSWILSSIERGSLQVRAYISAFDFEPMEFPEGRPCSILPTDMTPEQSGPAEMELMASLSVCRRASELDASLERNMRVLAKYFDRQRHVSASLALVFRSGTKRAPAKPN